MSRTANINVRIEPEVKHAAEKLYSGFGITVSDAVNIFLRQSIMVGGLPFEMRQQRYNAETEAAMREAKQIAAGTVPAKTYDTVQELFEDLDSEC